jgi:multiple sugar transport system ATP-binding protein
MATVELKHVYKRYEKAAAPSVVDANLTILDREFVVLVGPSGCGKSTTLRMIAGLESITEGELSIDGRVVNDVAPKDRDIAMVFQNYALYPHMSVYDNMAFGLKIRKLPKEEIDGRVREAARILGIEDLLERRPRQLSGGQRQRVAVGRAIVRQPKVFLFDEPLSNLDAKLRVQMRAEIIALHRRLDATMVYVTHDQVEAMTMGDRIVVMKDGVIRQVGTPLELYERPADRFVAGFIGSPPMNFIGVTIRAEGGNSVADSGAFAAPLSPAQAAALAPYAGRSIDMGIRPEHVLDEPAEGAFALEADVEIIEPLGAETYVHFKAGNTAFMGKFRSSTGARPGETRRRTWLDLGKARFFDAEGEGQKAIPTA